MKSATKFLLSLGVLFFAELLIMGFFRVVEMPGGPVEDVVDATLLCVVVSPFIHRMVMAEKGIVRLNRTLRMSYTINQEIIRARSRTGLFDSACRIAVEGGGFRAAWVSELRDKTVTVKAAAGSANGGGDDNALSIPWPSAEALASGRRIVCNDVAGDPPAAGWRDEALWHGCRSLAAFPLRIGQKTVGSYNVCSSTPNYFNDREIYLFEEIASDISHSLEFMEHEEKRGLAEDGLRKSQAALTLKNRELSALNSVAEIIASARDLGDMLQKALDKTLSLSFLEIQKKGVIFLRDGKAPDFLNMAAQSDLGPELLETEKRIPLGHCLCGRAAESGELLVSRDCFADARHATRFPSMKRHGHVVLPIKGKDAVLGVMAVYLEPDTPVTDAQVRLLTAIAHQLAVAIENRRLFQSTEQLEEVSRLKSEFLASMSHELRTPLNAVIGLSQALRDETYGPLSPKQSEYLDGINQSGRHLLELINEILDLSRIEAGKQRLEPSEFSMADTLKNAFILVREKAMKQGIDLVQEIDPGIVRFYADERRVRQILYNLLSNAVKFTEPGGKVGLRAGRDGTALSITVWDTGIGIPEDKKRLLFQPFQMIDSSLSKKHEGTGLGLVLTRRLAEMHGGSISFESSVGEGSSFTVRLPVTEPEPAWTGEAARLPAGPVSAAACGGKTAMVVEDNRLNMMLTSDHLRTAGMAVVEAVNGEAALEKVARVRPDVILLDIQMPGMDGFEVIRRLKENPLTRDIPVIAMTALAMKGDEQRCLDAGFSEYVSKPVDLKDMLEKVCRHASGGPSGR